MSGLPLGWALYTPGAKIPDGFVLYQNTAIPHPAFNTTSAQGFFQTATTIPQPTDKSTMPAYVAQRLRSAALEPFAGANSNNTTTWIQSAQSKLAQMKCPQQFWITEISIQLTHNAGTCATSGMKNIPKRTGIPVVIHMCAVFQARVDLASNKDKMLKSDNVWLAGNAVN
ncbi:hypothetical protein DSO57_1021262 [Entomophthora muscae]|uniref:Uncharacterized protein n=1 Tax=Entomophthora muscae TaxID=34485 RepID=A0ACC2RIG1_9FUNG|nr:hypothetical protein DSO57_1021262 [Entomophthora muscae]